MEGMEGMEDMAGTVIMHSVVSVDGYIADDNDDPGPLHEWYFSGDTPIRRDQTSTDPSGVDSDFRVSSASAGYVSQVWQSLGTIVMGRRLFDRRGSLFPRHPA